MGSAKTTKTGQLYGGLLFPERCKASVIADQGASPLSSFGEATPRPGLPIVDDAYSRLRLEVSHAQGTDIDARVVLGGQPARNGVQLALKKDSEAATEWRGWNGPQMVTGWLPIAYATSGTDLYDAYDLVTIPSTQQVMIVNVDPGASKLLTPYVIAADWTVTTAAGTISSGTVWNTPAICVLPHSERILVFYGNKAYYSDNTGASWSTYSTSVAASPTNYGATCVAVYRDNIIMFVEDTATANTVHQLASTDGGVTFQLVKTVAGMGTSVDVIATDDGIMVVWTDTAADPVFRKLGSVFEEIDAVSATQIAAVTHVHCTIAADDTGTLYVMSTLAGGAYMYESLDAGESWSAVFDSPVIEQGTATDEVENPRAVWALGQMLVAYYMTDNGVDVDEILGVAVCGGWSNVLLVNSDGDGQQPKDRWGWGQMTGPTGAAGDTWAPYIVPQNCGWTLTGAATPALHSDGAISISSSANNGHLSQTFTNHVACVILAELKVVSGGSASTRDVAIVVRLADNTNDYECEVLLSQSAIVVNDTHSAATATTAVDLNTDYVQLMVYVTEGTVDVWYRDPGSTTWTSTTQVALTNDTATPSASGIIDWGNIATATAESRWRLFCFATSQDSQPQVTDTIGTQLWGKSFNARGSYVPDMGSGTDVCRIAAVSGPARANETVSIAAYYEHGIEQAHAEVSPSPTVSWRSADLTTQHIVYDLGANQWIGGSVALFIAKANFRYAYLESYNGSTWDTRATLDLADGFTGLTHVTSGDMIYPNTGSSADADRYLYEQERRDGWVQAAGAQTSATRIVAHSAGGWGTGTSVVPYFELADSSKVSTSTTVSLVAATGMVIWHPATVAQSLARYWRVRIDTSGGGTGTAGDDTPDGETYYEAGIIAVCRVQPLGGDWEWGKSTERTSNTEVTEDAHGTLRAAKRGPRRREWTMGWPTPANHVNSRGALFPDYIEQDSNIPLVAWEDIPYMLEGLQDATDGGVVPVIAVEDIPLTSGTIITDPRRFLYGRWTTSVRTSHDAGYVGTDETLRTETITITEIV